MKKLAILLFALLLCAGTAAAEARSDAVMADFNGTWNATVVDMGDMQLSVTEMGLRMVIIVSNGTAVVMEGEGEEVALTEGAASVENGALTIQIKDDLTRLSLQLHTDGRLSFTEEESGMIIYFEKLQ